MQLTIGTLMLAISFHAEEYMNNVRVWVSPICLFLSNSISLPAVRAYLFIIRSVYYSRNCVCHSRSGFAIDVEYTLLTCHGRVLQISQ